MATAAEIPYIARQYDIAETIYTTGVTVTIVAKQDGQRVAIGFSQPASGSMFVSTRSAMGTTDAMPLLTNGGIMWFSLSDSGTFCQQQWYAAGNTPAAKMTVLEVWYRNR